MPVKRCQINGKQGWKWGDEGTCYTGPDAKERAIRQGIAALRSQARRAGIDEDEYIETHRNEL